MLRAMLGALFVVGFAIVASGCQKEVTSAPATTTRDVIRIGVPEANFGSSDIGIEQFARIFSHEGLADIGPGPDGRVVPTLSKGWRWEPGGLQLHIQLPETVFTHDGQPLTASIVAEALRRAVAMPANRELYGSLSAINQIDVTAENEITLSLSRAAGALPEDLNVPLIFGDRDQGTGPYRLSQRTSEETVLERFEQYHGGRPTIKHIAIKPYATLRTAWASLLRGEIDMVTNVPADAVEFISNDRVLVTSFPRVHQYVVGFNSTRTPFRSAVVRRALNLAVNRQEIVTRILKGRGVAATGPLWPKHWAIEGFEKAYAFDPRAAEALLDAAGFRRALSGNQQIRFTFTCLLPANFSTEEHLALEIQKDLYDIGVEVKFQSLSPADYIKRILSGNFDAVLTEMISGPTFSRSFLFWRSARNFKGGFNTYGYENQEAERLFARLQETTNETVIRSMARRLQEVFLDDPPALFLAWSERASAISRNFRLVQDSGRDPLFSLWRWTFTTDTEDGSVP